MLTIKITHILNARGIVNPFTFLVDSGFSRHTATNLLHSQTRSFRLDHIEHLCRILNCEPNDVVAFHPSTKYPVPSNHPLNNLIKKEAQGTTIKNSLQHLPYKELMRLSDQIAGVTSKSKDNTE